MQSHAYVFTPSAGQPASADHHRYAVEPANDGWTLTRDGRSIGAFRTQAEALCVGEKITRDLARAGIDVEFAAPEGARW